METPTTPTITNETTLDKSVFGKKSIFDGIYVYEHVNPEELFNVINTAQLIDFNGTRHAKGIGKLYKTERDLLIAYQYQWVNAIGAFVSEWKLLDHGWGRIFPTGYLSMSIFHRPTRHTLCDKHLVDLDLVNCHYEIILSKLQQLGMEHKAISEYCANVTHYRKLVANHYGVGKDSAKSLFIRILYGGSVNGWKIDNHVTIETIPPILVRIQNEMSAFIDLVWQGNQHIYNDLITEDPNRFVGEYVGKDRNTVMSFWCQSIERYLQESCIQYLVSKYTLKVNNFIPCQDGFMMKLTDYKPEYVDEINTYIRDSLGMVSRMIMKPFDEKYPIGTPSICQVFSPFDMLHAEDAQYAQYLIDACFKYTEMVSTGSDKLLEAYQYNGIYWEKLPIHNAEFHKGRLDTLQLWCERKLKQQINVIVSATGKKITISEKDANRKIKELEKEIRGCDADVVVAKKQEIKYLQEYCQLRDNIKPYERALDLIKVLSCNTKRMHVIAIYLSKIHQSKIDWDADPELFAFNNRVINLSTGEPIKPTKDQYIRTTCGWDWDDAYDAERITRVKTLVESILPVKPVRDYYLAFESTGLSGNKVQRVLISTGTGGNGKSLLRELKNGVVGDYGMKIPTDLLCAPIKGCVANPVIANMNGKRSLYFSEPNAGQKICSATFKELTGDNEIVGRALYSSDTKVTLVATLSGDCNTIPLFSDMSPDSNNSLLRRLGIAPFITRAVTQAEYDEAEDKTHLNIKQDFAENRSWMRDHRQAYFIVLLEAYKRFKETPNLLEALPDECRDRALAHLNASCDIMSWLECEMEKTETIDASKAIPLKDLYLKFKSHERFETFTKAEKRKYTQKYFVNLLENAKGLGKYIKDRKEYHGGKQLTSHCLVGHCFISDDNSSGIEEV